MTWYESKLAIAVAIQVAIVIVLLMYIVNAMPGTCKTSRKDSRKSGFLACTINGNECVDDNGGLRDGIIQTYEVPFYDTTMVI